jgi:hypothetical protein
MFSHERRIIMKNLVLTMVTVMMVLFGTTLTAEAYNEDATGSVKVMQIKNQTEAARNAEIEIKTQDGNMKDYFEDDNYVEGLEYTGYEMKAIGNGYYELRLNLTYNTDKISIVASYDGIEARVDEQWFEINGKHVSQAEFYNTYPEFIMH